MGTISTVDQYYNLFDATKGYTELLYRAGKVLQSKELNEMQSIIKNQIKNVGDTILTNGDIVEGCQLVVDGTNVTLTKGRIYLNGNVHSIEDTRFTISGKGTELIGAVLKSEVITPDEDNNLIEVASGYDNYNQDGAYRLKEYVEITVNDNNASTLYTLIDGQQQSVNTAEDLTQLDKINATLARRTFDESGNYKVNGLKLVDKNYSDEDHIYISLEPGKAYVKGYEVSKISAQMVALDRVASLRQSDNEPKTYRDGTVRYPLNNNYVNTIDKIVAIVESTQTITRGSIIGGIDYLPLSPVVEIVSVVQGDTTYEQGADFQLLNDGIDWSIGSRAPNPGSSYEVTWTYNKTMKKDEDYQLFNDFDTNVGYVEFLDQDKPTNGSTFLVNYNFTLCRRDIISIDQYGNVIVTKGQPDIFRTVESPSVNSQDTLVLGSVLLRPATNEVVIFNNDTQTIPMLDLYKMLQRINNLEYNQSITDLDNEAVEGENATNLMGILTDGFIGLTKSDTFHSEWSATIDLDNQELTLPSTTGISKLEVDEGNDFKGGLFSRLLTTPYEEINLFNQSLATGIMRVNSYNAFPKRSSLRITPDMDNWIDETVIEIQNQKSKSVTLRRWWYHKGESWAQQEKQLWQSYGVSDGGSSLGWSGTSRTLTDVTNSYVDSAIMYMRENVVDLSIKNLEPNTDNVVATFDGRAVSLVPTQSKYQGTDSGSLKADENGEAYGKFRVPAKTLCGVREVKVYPSTAPSLASASTYTSEGRNRTTTQTTTTTRVALNPTDPLAQSFQFDGEQVLTGVGLYFHDKVQNEPITIQVRNMVNGYPGTTVYAETVVQPNKISVSTDATAETVIKFEDPVFCKANEQYCFTVLSNSDVDSLWIAETTKVDIASRAQITKNPYLNGMLFSSSNALTWTAHQSSDMKFKLYGAKFELEGHALFKPIENLNIDRLMVMSEETIPVGGTIQWKYQINNGEWLPIETYDDRELSEVANTVLLRADMTANTCVSPAIPLDSLNFAGFENAKTGTYISKNVNIADGFNHVKIVVDLAIPASTNINVYYATDINGTDWKTLENTNLTQKSAEFKTYTFEADLDETANDYRCKVVLTTTDQVKRPRAQNLRSILTNI